MPLPALIEIVPLTQPVRAEITVPGSKSITNRALVLAALASGKVTLEGALWSEDTQVMVEGLQALGFNVEVAPDPSESCNRLIKVQGLDGMIPNGGTRDHPLELFVGNAGTVARFLAVLVCLGNGVYRLHGVPRMHERPQAALFHALRELGYCIDSTNDRLPALIHGAGPRKGTCCVSIAESSQFASALLLGARLGRWQILVVGDNAEESPYVAMTNQMIAVFPNRGGSFRIEPDASSGSYFWAAGALLAGQPLPSAHTAQPVRIARWPDSDWQIDARFPSFLPLPERLSRWHQLGDSIMTAMVLAPFAPRSTQFTDLGRLRVQECERVKAMRTELSKCGGRVNERNDTLEIFPAELHGAEIETYNDHRIAMCFAILGLKVPGLKIKNPACVKKTFPNFFQKLATPPPAGLGATILDAATGRALSEAELFAE
ncbi:MAG: 3-phosphoshikimate 1-carboxyvinyltransferase [Verrucomicrobia bacterium]|nr:3-phosphoshikimate 1-carboxyvinyltransferase [Verrucomicrobiota bacterium]